MKVEIQFEAQLRQVAEAPSVQLDLAEGTSLAAGVAQAAEGSAQALRDRLLADDGSVRAGLLVFVNDQPVSADRIPDTALCDGDTVLLLPPISGG